jgi:hypothetical protein
VHITRGHRWSKEVSHDSGLAQRGHFHDAVKNGSIVVKKINTTFQLTDPLTKPLPQHRFEMLRQLSMGW